MPRVKRGVVAHRRHKKILKQAKGYYGARSRTVRTAKQAVESGDADQMTEKAQALAQVAMKKLRGFGKRFTPRCAVRRKTSLVSGSLSRPM